MVRWTSRKVWGKPNEIAFSCLNRSFGWWCMSGSVSGWFSTNESMHIYRIASHRNTLSMAKVKIWSFGKNHSNMRHFLLFAAIQFLWLFRSLSLSLSLEFSFSLALCVFAFFSLYSLLLKGECKKRHSKRIRKENRDRIIKREKKKLSTHAISNAKDRLHC